VFDRTLVTREEFDARTPAISERVYEIASSLGGSISAEHGIGISLRDKLPAYKDATELALMRALKRMLDPNNILNPAKMIAQ
jgi:FAD/FMN-containing dehydrogenase